MKPFWYKLLESKAKNATGLTIPFLIGASKLSFVSSEMTISELIIEISDNEFGKVMLKYCHETRDSILTVSDYFIRTKYCIPHIPFGSLLVVPEKNLKGLKTLDEIIISLEIDYNEDIEAENYSIKNERFQKFDNEDLAFIENSLKKS